MQHFQKPVQPRKQRVADFKLVYSRKLASGWYIGELQLGLSAWSSTKGVSGNPPLNRPVSQLSSQ